MPDTSRTTAATNAPPAGLSKEEVRIHASATAANTQMLFGQTIEIPVAVDMRVFNEKLGSYTVKIEWDPAVLQFENYRGGNTVGFENPVVNSTETANGKLIAAHAYPEGAGEVVNILNLQFKVVNTGGSQNAIFMDFSAMAAAGTFIDLLPYLEVSDEKIALTEEVPQTFKIDHYPNPFNPVITIRYQLPKASEVKLVIYNVLGQQVRKLVNQPHQPGYFKAEWDARNDAGAKVGSGVYIYRFQAGEYQTVQKIILLK